MKYLILFISVCCPFLALSQNKDTAYVKSVYISAGFAGSGVTFPKLDRYKVDAIFFSYTEGRTFPGGGPEVLVSWTKNRNLKIQAGFNYFFADDELSYSSVGTYYEGTSYKLTGFRIPFILNYNLTRRERRVMFNALGGAEILQAKVIRTRTQGSSREVRQSSIFTPNMMAGIDMNLRISKGIKLYYNILLASNISTIANHVSLGLRFKLHNKAQVTP
ncbi:MAG: hypothetical protein H7Y13_17485 [Sphingobacteriaceae bacterium]|nr:hypothetical protein [Sphingobacteriaceae bacterium]